jgi:hypothetical protein
VRPDFAGAVGRQNGVCILGGGRVHCEDFMNPMWVQIVSGR